MASESRGLLAGVALDPLRARTTQAPHSVYWQNMLRRWQEISAWETSTGQFWNLGACGGRFCTPMMLEAALIHRLTGDGEALAWVERQFDKLAAAYARYPESLRETFGRFIPLWSHANACLSVDLCRESFDPARLELLRRMVREHFLDDGLDWNGPYRYLAGHNILFTAQACAGVCALTFGEESGHPEWESVVNGARDACVLYARHGLDAGGSPFEGTMYGQIPIHLICHFAQLLYQNGRDNLFESMPVLQRVPDAIQSMLLPDRSAIAPISDGGLGSPKPFYWLLLTAQHYDRPQDLAFWYAFRGPDATAPACPENNPPPHNPEVSGEGHPVRRDAYGHDIYPFLWWDGTTPSTPLEAAAAPTANYLPGTEICNFRTSWRRQATYVNFLGQGRSHSSLDHNHVDCGHFTIFAYGELLAIDTGYWNVAEDQHSALLVDGTPSIPREGTLLRHRAGAVRAFKRHAMLDYAVVDAANVKNCMWADRHLLFVRLGGDDCYIVVLDNANVDDKVHSYDWLLQAHPESEVTITGETTACVRRQQARLDITISSPRPEDFPAAPHALQLRTDHCYCAYVENHTPGLSEAAGVKLPFLYTEAEARREANDLLFSSFYRPRLIASQTGPNCLLLAVISPRPADAPPLTVRQIPMRRTFRVEVDCGEFVDTIIAAPDHGYLTMPDVRGFAELAVIRRDRDGKVIDYWTVEGLPLELA